MNYILFDYNRHQLLPFTHTRPVADIRCGILTMRERWELCLQATTETLTEKYLRPLFHSAQEGDNIYINGAVAANYELVNTILKLESGQKLVKGDSLIALKSGNIDSLKELETILPFLTTVQFEGETYSIQHVWDIFSLNDRAIKEDFELITNGRNSEPLPGNVIVTGKNKLFIEAGSQINAGTIINTTSGPVYVGKDAEIWEGSMLRGPLAICEHAVVKMGAKIYGATTIGPGCKVGGEISNAVFFANSNKGHDGFLGNAVIGEWCNLGADTNASNLKNNYDEVKIWDEHSGKSIKTGLTFLGLLMGDHSKCGINTMFNTGTVVGVSCNIYGGSFPEKFIPSFSWGGSDGVTTYSFDRAMETADRMMHRRGKKLSATEIEMYKYIFENTAAQRKLIKE